MNIITYPGYSLVVSDQAYKKLTQDEIKANGDRMKRAFDLLAKETDHDFSR